MVESAVVVDAETGALSGSLVLAATGGNGNNGNQSNGNGTQDKPTGSDVNKTSTVVKQFVVDFSREDYKPLMEHEVNGLTYRYVNSDKARLSVVVQGIETGSVSLLDEKGELHAYYHTDYLGTTDYLTSAVNSKAISWTSYVVMQDGKLTSLDNRRLFAAKHTNTEVQANIHAFDSALSATEIGIVAVGKNVPAT